MVEPGSVAPVGCVHGKPPDMPPSYEALFPHGPPQEAANVLPQVHPAQFDHTSAPSSSTSSNIAARQLGGNLPSNESDNETFQAASNSGRTEAQFELDSRLPPCEEVPEYANRNFLSCSDSRSRIMNDGGRIFNICPSSDRRIMHVGPNSADVGMVSPNETDNGQCSITSGSRVLYHASTLRPERPHGQVARGPFDSNRSLDRRVPIGRTNHSQNCRHNPYTFIHSQNHGNTPTDLPPNYEASTSTQYLQNNSRNNNEILCNELPSENRDYSRNDELDGELFVDMTPRTDHAAASEETYVNLNPNTNPDNEHSRFGNEDIYVEMSNMPDVNELGDQRIENRAEIRAANSNYSIEAQDVCASSENNQELSGQLNTDDKDSVNDQNSHNEESRNDEKSDNRSDN